MGVPSTCSGLEYSGVKIKALAPLTAGWASGAARILAIPKSNSFTAPSGVTRILPGFRSQCTTRLSWAY